MGAGAERRHRGLYRDDAFSAFVRVVSVPFIKGKSSRYAWA